MKAISMKSIVTILCLVLLSTEVSSLSVEASLRNKLRSSAPTIDSAKFKSLITKLPTSAEKWHVRINVSGLASLKNKVQKTKTGEITFQSKLYKEMQALKWADSFETLEYKNIIRSGRSMMNYNVVTGLVGVKNGSIVEANAIISITHGFGRGTYRQVRYRHCKRILFWKKCSWKTKTVSRALYNSELLAI